MKNLRTDVAIIGGGPAGLLLSQLLRLGGVDSIVLERRTRAYVESRIRAGVLESGTAALLARAGLGAQIAQNALFHDGFNVCFEGGCFRVDLKKLAGSPVVVYGQTEITRDLYQHLLAAGAHILFDAEDVALHDIDSAKPRVSFSTEGVADEISCDFVAGCDGSHGISRASVPPGAITVYERTLPHGWLGVLSETPPVADELIYSRSSRGFALCSMRSRALSRYYVQCPISDHVEDWPDERFWDELRSRIPEEAAARLITGPAVEKSIAPLRSFVAEPMRFGRLFLAGDAAHIVPPTGAKGLNLAAWDAGELASALLLYYRERDVSGLESYSATALRRAWSAVRFSWWMTLLTHRLGDEFSDRIQQAEFELLRRSPAAAEVLAKSYCGTALG